MQWKNCQIYKKHIEIYQIVSTPKSSSDLCHKCTTFCLCNLVSLLPHYLCSCFFCSHFHFHFFSSLLPIFFISSFLVPHFYIQLQDAIVVYVMVKLSHLASLWNSLTLWEQQIGSLFYHTVKPHYTKGLRVRSCKTMYTLSPFCISIFH